ncbi:hypothetical protein BE20_19055 [Sorangium cellulosum]|nr:hypothetical protein BE20_19055 [Sorangium cellulosum]
MLSPSASSAAASALLGTPGAQRRRERVDVRAEVQVAPREGLAGAGGDLRGRRALQAPERGCRQRFAGGEESIRRPVALCDRHIDASCDARSPAHVPYRTSPPGAFRRAARAFPRALPAPAARRA